jgi:hypothetical protein
MVFLGLLGELLLAAEVLAKADLEEDEGAVLAVKTIGVRSGVGLHFSGVDDVRGGSRSWRNQVVEIFFWEDPSRYSLGGRHNFFVIPRYLPMHRERLCVYEHIELAILAERSGRSGWG